MKVTILGTGTSGGVPMVGCDCEVCQSKDPRDKRLRTSVFIQTDRLNLLIDAGPDLRQQLITHNIKRIDAVLFTHEHKDHIAGIDELRGIYYHQRKTINLYATEAVQDRIKKEYDYFFDNSYFHNKQLVKFVKLDGSPLNINGLHITPIRVMHHTMPVLGFRMGNFCYITDVNHISAAELDKVRDCEVLVITGLQWKPHISHYTIGEAMDVSKSVKAKNTYFTHISHRLGTTETVEKQLPDNMHLALDGMQFYF